MGTLSQVMVALGFVLMVFNIITVVRFIRDQDDVIMGERGAWQNYIVLAFVIVFAIVYAVIFVQNFAELTIGVILLSGSAFVTIVLQWIYHLVSTVKAHTMEMAEALTTVIDARDRQLRGHSRHVQCIASLIYDALPEAQRRTINKTNLEYAAIFHDIGKLGISEAVLNKPGRLDDQEWQVIRTHPKIGVDILSPVSSFSDIQDWIMYHHERPDGKGYYGLTGDEIPLGAKIVSVADVFSACLMKRPYKEASSYEEVIEVLRGAAGAQLDAGLVEVFCSIPREKVLACSDVLSRTESSEA